MYGSWVLLLLIFISSIPVIIVFIWFHTAKYKIPIFQFSLALLAGAAAFFPALVLQNILQFPISAGSRQELFYNVFIRLALTEEFSRLLLLFILFQTTVKFGQSLSIWKGAAFGLVAGFGFAILENAVYAASDIRILLLRAVTAAPLHAACGSRVGAAAVMLRSSPLKAFFQLLSATAIHGIYNIMIAGSGIVPILAVLLALSALFTAISTIRTGQTSEQKIEPDT